MKKPTKSAKGRGGVKAKQRVKPAAKRTARAASTRPAKKKAKAKPKAPVKAKAPSKAKAPAKATPKAKARRTTARGSGKSPRQKRAASHSKWLAFVEKYGVVLASAKGPVPTLTEAIAGEPIVGSWWAHPRGKEIFEALSEVDDSVDVRCFKLVDGKVTFVHRKAWPALVRLGQDGVIAAEQLSAFQQEHMPSGEHRNIVTPFPDWVDDATQSAAAKLSTEQARAQLSFVEG